MATSSLAPFKLDFTPGPHILVTGPTGAGKSVALTQIAMAAMARGHEVHIMEPTKGGVDFLKIKPFTASWGDTLDRAAAQAEAIYAEVQRRKELLTAHGHVKATDSRLDPMTVIIDEYSAVVTPTKIPDALPEGDLRTEAEADTVARATIASYVAKLIREGRFAGVHVVIGVQRPDTPVVSAEMHGSFSTKVLLLAPGKPVSKETLEMMFPADLVRSARHRIDELDDGRSAGRALVGIADFGSVASRRIPVVDQTQTQTILEAVSVPRRQQWDLG